MVDQLIYSIFLTFNKQVRQEKTDKGEGRVKC